MDCANLSDVMDTCLGFQYLKKTHECNLISAIRNVISNNKYCSFYMKTTTTPMTILGRCLDTTDQMLQDLLYESKGDCPDGWTATPTKCTLPLPKAKCAEYASFLSATYSDGCCIMAILTFQWLILLH
uniref:DUF19 domain-containing protein n=1 Tax=Panagrellus redivivus TaxID=6233 RepID=A0A7E4V357_PANRE